MSFRLSVCVAENCAAGSHQVSSAGHISLSDRAMGCKQEVHISTVNRDHICVKSSRNFEEGFQL